MSKIRATYPCPEIKEKIEILSSLGRDRIVQEIQKQIYLTIQKGGALFHIDKQLDEEIERAREEV